MALPGDVEKEKGNQAFRKGEFAIALNHYDEAIAAAGETGPNLAALYGNKAATLLKLKMYQECILECHNSVFAPGLTTELFLKSFRRLGEAYEAQGMFEEASASFEQVGTMEPSVWISAKITELEAKLSNANKHTAGFLPTLNMFMLMVKDVLEHNVPSLKPLLNEFQSGNEEYDNGFSAVVAGSPFMKNYGQMKGKRVLLAEHAEIQAAMKKYRPNYERLLEDPRVVYLAPIAVTQPTSHTCCAELRELQRVNIDQLRFEEVNVGKLLVCRTVAYPYSINAVCSVIEDPAGNFVRFHAYNVCTGSTKPFSVVPPGGYFAIKEPIFKTGSIIGRPAVIIESKSQLVYLEFTHYLLKDLAWQTPLTDDVHGFQPSQVPPPNVPAWEVLKNQGNDYFKQGHYEFAVAKYTDAIVMKTEGCKADLYSNRAAAYLKQGMFDEAAEDCLSALKSKPGHAKATYRLEKAYAGMELYEDAREVLESHSSAETPDFATEIARLGLLLAEQNVGKFDLKGLIKQAIACETIRFDHAEYNADGVGYEWISNAKGFGLLAPRDYAPGELIFVSKALDVVYNAEIVLSDASRDCTAHKQLVARVIEHISKDTYQIHEVNHLFAGPEFKRFADFDSKEATSIDPKRIDGIVAHCAFGASWDGLVDGKPISDACVALYGSRTSWFQFDGCGLWILPSFLNHSCVPNTSRMFVGDLMFVRAAKPIAKGDELRTRCMEVQDFKGRRNVLEETFHFICDCELCECDKRRCDAYPQLDGKRLAAFRDFWAVFNRCVQPGLGEANVTINEKLVESVREAAEQFSDRFSYKNRFDEFMSRIHAELGFIYNQQRKFAKAAMAYEKAYFALLGNEIQQGRSSFIAETQTNLAIMACLPAALNFFWAGNKEKGKHYYGELLRSAKQLCGVEDLEIISLLFPKLQIKLLKDAVKVADSNLKFR